MFDVAQTEGKPLPKLTQKLTGDTELYQKLINIYSEKYEISEEILGAIGGYTDGNKIAINSGNDERMKLKTLVHEIAHCELHHGERRAELSRAERELEAETTAFIVCEALGIDSGQYTIGYVATWAKGDIEKIMDSISIAHEKAKEIYEFIKAELVEKGEAA